MVLNFKTAQEFDLQNVQIDKNVNNLIEVLFKDYQEWILVILARK